MGGFTPLPIYPGHVGPYHMNRFRICVAATEADKPRFAAIAKSHLQDMPHYMHPHTARVTISGASWMGNPTLRFVGKARVRPFSIPVPLPFGGWELVPVPENIRDWMIPELHSDLVGLVAHTPTSFTVQTLKREYLESFEILLTLKKEDLVELLRKTSWFNAYEKDQEDAIDKIVAGVIWINQHHFLAGRRAFRFDDGINFGYTDGRWVFETAAMERFSHLVFWMSQLAIGDAEDVVRPLWLEMMSKFCQYNGLRVIPDTPLNGQWRSAPGNMSYLQERFPAYGAMIHSTEGKDIAARYPAIHP